MDLPGNDVLIASAASFLIDGGEEDSAGVLLSCTIDTWDSGDNWLSGNQLLTGLHIELTGPRAAYDVLSANRNRINEQVRAAIEAVLPPETYIRQFTARAELVDIELDSDWRSELLEIARGKRINNQGLSYGVNPPPSLKWNNMKFRSASERKIAGALDTKGVLFLPNCMARLGEQRNRRNREADFLICDRQKWGILEVDGEPFHPPSRTVHDHERDRLFRHHGIRVVEHFDANRCYQDPDGGGGRFFEIVARERMRFRTSSFTCSSMCMNSDRREAPTERWN
jgi:hypothetical protein